MTTAVVDRHWALFADWCTAVDVASVPATPETVLAFLAELPAGPATVRRRVLAIDAAHRHAGYPPPSASPAFDALLRPPRPPRFDPDLVANALAIIPVGGWSAGIVGRRDAALVALVCTAGLTRHQIQYLRTSHSATQGEEQRRPGTAGESGLPAVAATEHPGPCPACALTRRQRVATTTAAAGWRTVRNYLADLGETTAEDETSHDCTRPAGELTGDEDERDSGHTARRHSDSDPSPSSVPSTATALLRPAIPSRPGPSLPSSPPASQQPPAPATPDRPRPSLIVPAPPPYGAATTTPASSQHAKPPPTASPASKPTSTKPTPTPKPSSLASTQNCPAPRTERGEWRRTVTEVSLGRDPPLPTATLKGPIGRSLGIAAARHENPGFY